MPKMKIDVNSAAVMELMALAPKKVGDAIHALLEGAGIDTQAMLRQNAPIGTTGDLRRGAHYFFKGDDTVIAEPTSQYAAAVESGSRPHWVSVRPGTALYNWAVQKGVPPFAVQWSIAMKGTKAHPFVEPTYAIMQPKINRDFDRGIERLVAQFNG